VSVAVVVAKLKDAWCRALEVWGGWELERRIPFMLLCTLIFGCLARIALAREPQRPQAYADAFTQYVVLNKTVISIRNKFLPDGVYGIPYNATLSGSGGLAPYTWAIVAGSLPNGLSLDSNSGVIAGTPTIVGVSNFTVQITDKNHTSATSNLSITVNQGFTNATLKGNYAFTFNGYSNGTPVLMAGSFVADGQGKVTSGVLDYNDGSGEQPDNNPAPQVIGAGSVYTINPDGLGTMTITTNQTVFNLSVAITSDGSGRLIQSDPANPQAYGSGAIKSQTPLSQWPLCGSHVVVGLFGLDSSLVSRYSAAGEFQFDPNTCVDAENGVMDVNDGGNYSPNVTFTGAFNQYDPNTGRGIAGITFKPGGRRFYAFYLVSSSDHKKNELILVSTDPTSEPAALTLWSGLQQAFPPTGWDNSSLGGTTVAELNAVDTNGAADVTAGLFVGNGVAGNNCQSNNYDPATFNFDENQGGTSNLNQSSTGTYCVDKTTGRVTLTPFNIGPFATPPVFYMVKGGVAFAVGTDPAVTAGILEEQTGSPFSASSIFGPYSGGTVTPVLPAVTNAVTSLFADGSMNMNGMQDISGPGGPGQQNFTYTYTADSTGRAVVQQNGNAIGIAYVISPTQFVLLPIGPSNQFPALSIFGQ
jgi:hypothetical protein